jgi:DNA-binding HxlR family transcriptional regulator
MNTKKYFNCSFELTIDLIGGKWKVLILWHILDKKVLRNGEMLRLMPQISQKMLTQQLREMEETGLICRRVYEQLPYKVEYTLTSHGEALRPVLEMMLSWGLNYAKDKNIIMECKRLQKHKG